MLNISNVSLYSFRVALRWASRQGWPQEIKDWTEEQSSMLQSICEEVDARNEARRDDRYICTDFFEVN